MENESMLTVRGEHDEATVSQMWRCLSVGSAVGGVLCADGHLGYSQPVGGVVAYESHVSISGVGFDIGCGNMAVKTDIKASALRGREEGIAKKINSQIDFGVGGKYAKSRSDLSAYEYIFDDDDRWHAAGVKDMKDLAYQQLGTVGGGNHYVDVFVEGHGPQAPVWVGVHFGSRGLGHRTANRYLRWADGRDGIDAAPCLVDPTRDLGARYVGAMELAGEYANAGRRFVVSKVLKILGARAVDEVHNHHNYAWVEKHGDREYWVVRKGATPSFPGQRGFVGGSMGDCAVIIEGKSTDLLASSVHGAGRLFSRSAAKKTFTRSQMDAWLREYNVTLIGGDLDESPMAYRRLNDVLKHHEDTVEVKHTLRPVIVVMAGAHERDPYKD